MFKFIESYLNKISRFETFFGVAFSPLIEIEVEFYDLLSTELESNERD